LLDTSGKYQAELVAAHRGRDPCPFPDCYLVIEGGYENLTCHTELDTFRVAG
jgi:hypothetical protein